MTPSSAKHAAKVEPSSSRSAKTPKNRIANGPASVVAGKAGSIGGRKPAPGRAAAADARSPSIKEPAKPTPATPAAASSGKALSGEQASKVATAAVKAATATDLARSAANQPSPPPAPKSWAEITVGSLVIAHESVVDGWWEAIVLEVNGDKLMIRWRDYPRQPTVVRGKAEIAFLAKAA
jgi:hypothetical protein